MEINPLRGECQREGHVGDQRAPAKQPEQTERPKELAAPKAPKADDKLLARGAELFARNCATCHGDKGMGDGQASYLLYPRPRDFSMGRFRLVSTDNGLPADEDLFRTLTRGMPGTAMPSWSHLPAEDRWALAFGVRKLIEAGRLARLRKAGVPQARAAVLASKFARPGKPVPVPPEPITWRAGASCSSATAPTATGRWPAATARRRTT